MIRSLYLEDWQLTSSLNHNRSDHQSIEQRAIDVTTLKTRGWISFKLTMFSESDLREQLFRVAVTFGTPTTTRSGGDLCDLLMPTRAHAARCRSLSRLYSIGEFPLHNDTAHWPTPCRYLILACVSAGSRTRPTFLLDTHRLPLTDQQASLLHTTPLCVRNGRHSFFSTILSKSRPFVRFDGGCMTTTTNDGAAALAIFSRQNWSQRIETFHWMTGTVLVIDNWRTLHGRGHAGCSDFNRRLLRISIR